MNTFFHTLKRIALRRPVSAQQAGFTLLLAALAASIALTLGTSIFSISQKQVRLSSLGRDSQYAFYTSDTVAECALYWDRKAGYFGTSTPSGGPFECAGQTLTATGRPLPSDPDPYPYVMTAEMEIGGLCARVSVTKCDGPITGSGVCNSASSPSIRTLVHADGFNVPCVTITNNLTALQRSIELRY